MRSSRSSISLLLLSGTVAIAVACGDDLVVVPAGQFGNDTGIIDTGFFDYDVGPGLIEPGLCLTNAVDGVYGYKYQCEGLFFAYITYGFDNALYTAYVPSDGLSPFGHFYDQYGSPKVMACCGEYDEQLAFEQQPQFALNCIMDAREQACQSILQVLVKIRNSLPDGGRKDAVRELHLYIQAHLTECIAGLHGNAFPSPSDPSTHSGTWEIVENWQTSGLMGADLTYTVMVDGVHWPQYDYPNNMDTCKSLRENNGNVFASAPAPLDYETAMLLDEAEIGLLGPVYEGKRITGQGDLASAVTSCGNSACSHVSVSEDSGGGWSIDVMRLFVEGSIEIGNGDVSKWVDLGHLELSGSASGTWALIGGDQHYEVRAGDAAFVAGGRADGVGGFEMVYNSTPITATHSLGEWYFDAFQVVYTDPVLGDFTLTIGESVWLED